MSLRDAIHHRHGRMGARRHGRPAQLVAACAPRGQIAVTVATPAAISTLQRVQRIESAMALFPGVVRVNCVSDRDPGPRYDTATEARVNRCEPEAACLLAAIR